LPRSAFSPKTLAPDVAVVGQDPRLRGGFRSQAAAFWRAASELHREARLFYVANDRAVSVARRSFSLASRRVAPSPFEGTAYPALLPEIDSINHLVNGRRMAEALRRSESLWVVTTSAHYGYPVACSGRSYACWVGTGYTVEAEARRAGLSPSRRAAQRVNAPIFRRLEREVLQGATFIHATSPASRRAVSEAADIPSDSIRLLPIAIDLEQFRPEPDETWVERLEEPVIVFVGRGSDPRKNVGLLVRAFRRIREQLPRARLRLVGREPPREVLGALNGGAEVLGEVDSVTPFLRSASLFVLPSLQEGFGVAVAESLASGVPALVTPCEGPEHLIRNSKSGRVLESFDEEELAATAVDLLTDTEGLADMRRRGREYVAEEHSPKRLRELLRSAFDDLERAS
jgi:glycosyltransferase involved in cell wall biosynthesis